MPLPSRAISHARGHLRVSRFARRTTEKRETARSLILLDVFYNSIYYHYNYNLIFRPVLITDVVMHWKAINWTKSFLVKNYGDKRVTMKATEVCVYTYH